MADLASNIFKTALYFEGGSMRASYTAAAAVKFLEEGVYFDRVYGISAGASNTVNYLSRDVFRTRASFTSFLDSPKVGSAATWLRHKGLLSAHYIYQEAGQVGGELPYDFATFEANPADLCVIAVDRDTGRDLYFTKADMPTVDDLMVRVRASSTLPALMPPPVIDGMSCYDGGFADGGGIPLRKIEADGYDRVVVLRTRPRGYRKADDNAWAKAFFARHPEMRDLTLTRSQRYNAACDELEQWERDGRAYVFYADDMALGGAERDVTLLQASFDAGYAQVNREWRALMSYLDRSEGRR